MQRSKSELIFKEDTERLARYAKALGHPVRIKILNHLIQQNTCNTGELVDVFPLAQSTVSQHLKELKNAGLIQGELEPPKVKYCINRKNWEEARSLLCAFFDIDMDASCCAGE